MLCDLEILFTWRRITTWGKPIGSDKSEGKVTFVDLLGVDGCQREVEAQTKRAKAAVAGWADSDFLRELADRMVLRVK